MRCLKCGSKIISNSTVMECMECGLDVEIWNLNVEGIDGPNVRYRLNHYLYLKWFYVPKGTLAVFDWKEI